MKSSREGGHEHGIRTPLRPVQLPEPLGFWPATTPKSGTSAGSTPPAAGCAAGGAGAGAAGAGAGAGAGAVQLVNVLQADAAPDSLAQLTTADTNWLEGIPGGMFDWSAFFPLFKKRRGSADCVCVDQWEEFFSRIGSSGVAGAPASAATPGTPAQGVLGMGGIGGGVPIGSVAPVNGGGGSVQGSARSGGAVEPRS